MISFFEGRLRKILIPSPLSHSCQYIDRGENKRIRNIINATRSVLLQFVDKLDSYCTTFDLAVIVSYHITNEISMLYQAHKDDHCLTQAVWISMNSSKINKRGKNHAIFICFIKNKKPQTQKNFKQLIIIFIGFFSVYINFHTYETRD